MSLKFTLHKESGKARRGRIETSHGSIETPAFMPVGTRGTVKTLTEAELREIGAEIILGNTYHLMLRPGCKIIQEAGGLHKFIGWNRPILTDSGGFQVFSLSPLNKISDEGAFFKSHIDGSTHFLGPKESMAIQKILGSDIVMCFDQCPPSTASPDFIELATKRSVQWARICSEEELQCHQSLFAIVQGGMNKDLRKQCADELVKLDLPGYAIGGLAVGETHQEMYSVIEETLPHLPKDKPRYLMGVGTPRNIFEAVKRGVDMFDCVFPSRNARGGTAFTWQGRIQIKSARYSEDFSPFDPELDAYPSKFSKAYIRHLLNVQEITGLTLVTMQNLAFYLDFMKKIREAISTDSLEEFERKLDTIYPE
jgi:queuine tRNA-ribosyltransferase